MIPKFRVWDKTDKEMYLVDVINFNRGEFESIGDGITFLREADEVILMQSTGLNDRNGQEVFVGDIIRCTRGCPHEVYLEKEYGGTYVGGMPAIYLKGLLNGYAWTGDEEIIGNVYQNPEFLEATNDRD